MALAACGSSSGLFNMWKDPTFNKPMEHVLVIAMKDQATRRRVWEDNLVSNLAAHGVDAVPSYRLFPDAVPDTESVRDAVRRERFDGVFIVHRLATEANERFVPGYRTTEPVTRYDPWARRYVTWYADVYHEGHTETDRVVRHQVDVWTTADGGHPVWIGTGEVLNPDSGDEVRKEVTKLIIPELAKQGVIPATVKS
jgi:hypothetical protein